MSGAGLLLRRVRLKGRRVDVRVSAGRITEIAAHLPVRGEDVLDCDDGTVLPGLHDHHVHLLATAAAVESVSCGPPVVRTRADFATALATARPRQGWIRAVDYHASVAGDLDRLAIDAIRQDVPVRVQHRGGSLWVVNSVAVAVLDLERAELPGVERDGAGQPTGRLWRLDGWLRGRLGEAAVPPDLGAVSRLLAARGVTGVTDATPDLDPPTVALLSSGAVVQRVVLLGDPAGTAPWKIVVSDHDLPGLDELVDVIRRVRPRPVAIHAVTRVSLVLTLAALGAAGSVPGDRIEHAAVVPPELEAALRKTGATVVTQPSLPARRGDEYLDDVDAEDREHLWPFASLVAAGVPVACSSDAPYGDLDPWASARAAATRRTPSGRPIGPSERVAETVALRGYLSPADRPGGPARRVVVGTAADLVVLGRDDVMATIIDGRTVFRA